LTGGFFVGEVFEVGGKLVENAFFAQVFEPEVSPTLLDVLIEGGEGGGELGFEVGECHG
jgi:hypothetical protein